MTPRLHKVSSYPYPLRVWCSWVGVRCAFSRPLPYPCRTLDRNWDVTCERGCSNVVILAESGNEEDKVSELQHNRVGGHWGCPMSPWTMRTMTRSCSAHIHGRNWVEGHKCRCSNMVKFCDFNREPQTNWPQTPLTPPYFHLQHCDLVQSMCRMCLMWLTQSYRWAPDTHSLGVRLSGRSPPWVWAGMDGCVAITRWWDKEIQMEMCQRCRKCWFG